MLTAYGCPSKRWRRLPRVCCCLSCARRWLRSPALLAKPRPQRSQKCCACSWFSLLFRLSLAASHLSFKVCSHLLIPSFDICRQLSRSIERDCCCLSHALAGGSRVRATCERIKGSSRRVGGREADSLEISWIIFNTIQSFTSHYLRELFSSWFHS